MKQFVKVLFVSVVLSLSISIFNSCVSCDSAESWFDDEYNEYRSDEELDQIRQKKQNWYNNLDEEEKQEALKKKEKKEDDFLNGIFGMDLY